MVRVYECGLCREGVLERSTSPDNPLRCPNCGAEYLHDEGLVLSEQWVKKRIEQKDNALVVRCTNEMLLLEGVTLRVWRVENKDVYFDLLVYAVASIHEVEGLQEVVQEGATPVTGLVSYNEYVLGHQKLLK